MDVRPLRQPLLPPHKLLHYITFRRFEQPISRPAAPRRAFLTFPPPAFCIFRKKPPRSAHNPAFWQLLTHFLHFGPEFFCKDPHSPPFPAGTAGKPFLPFRSTTPEYPPGARPSPRKKSPSGPIKPHRGDPGCVLAFHLQNTRRGQAGSELLEGVVKQTRGITAFKTAVVSELM